MYNKGDILMLNSGQKVMFIAYHWGDKELCRVKFRGYQNKWSGHTDCILIKNIKEKIS